MLVTLVLLGPALLLGAVFALAVHRHRNLHPRTETSLLLASALVLLIVGVVVLGVLALVVHASSGVPSIDRSIAPWGRDHTTSFSKWMLDFVTAFGTTGVIAAFTIGVLVVEMVRRPSRWVPVFVLTVVVGEALMSLLVKDLVDRARPTVNPIARSLGPSFPSGHTTGAAACFAAFALVIGRGRSRNVQSLLAGTAVFVAIAVAASRVLLGVHWFTDVVGGLALGWAWFALCSIAFGGHLLRSEATIEGAAPVTGAAERRSPSAPPGPSSRA